MDKKATALQALAQVLPAWYAEAARDLPWRHSCEPYCVWISEIMLQQTRVEAVKGYYARFLTAFPDAAALAAAPEEQILKLWEGLGYYSRARNLQKAARRIVEQHGGVFPSDYAAIRALPGVGDYTAGAIASICFDLPKPAVDGNVLRVCARICALTEPVDRPSVKREITDALAQVYPQTGCGTLTQALMELGATICIPRTPRCMECPACGFCAGYHMGKAAQLPVRSPKREKRMEARTVFLFYSGKALALEKRPEKGLLAGLWQLPNIVGEHTLEEAFALAREKGLMPQRPLWEKRRTHIFTHIRWEMHAYAIAVNTTAGNFVWALPEQLETVYALPTAFRQLLENRPEIPDSGICGDV